MLKGLREHLEIIREAAGPDMDILLDLNFNAKTEGYLKILREIADLDLFWVEIDTLNPQALGLDPLAEPRTRSRRARRCSACSSSCRSCASRRSTWRSSTRRGTACGSR